MGILIIFNITVPGSWRRTHAKNCGLKGFLSYSQFCRRVKLTRFNILKGKKRTYVCATCKACGSHCRSKTEGIIPEAICFIEGIYPGYFKDLPIECNFIDGEDFVRSQSPKYIRTLKDFTPHNNFSPKVVHFF